MNSSPYHIQHPNDIACDPFEAMQYSQIDRWLLCQFYWALYADLAKKAPVSTVQLAQYPLVGSELA